MVHKAGELSGEEPGLELSLWDQIDRLRAHVLRSLGVIAALGIVVFIFHKPFFGEVIFGPAEKDFISYRVACSVSKMMGAGESLCFEPPVFRKQTVGFAEAFITSVKVSFLVGFLLAFPFVLWELWRFLQPMIGKKVSQRAGKVITICSMLFALGVAFGYFILAPFSISWLIGYTIPGVENTPTLNSYINYMVVFTVPMGLIFELPVVSYFLARMGLLGQDTMRTYRRHAVVAILLIAGLITPTVDGITQLLVAAPLYMLYELSIFVVIRGKRQYDKED